MRQRPQASTAAKALVQYRSEAQNQSGELKARAKAQQGPPATPERTTSRPTSPSPKPKAAKAAGGERSPPSPKPKAEGKAEAKRPPPSPKPKAEAKAKPGSVGRRPGAKSLGKAEAAENEQPSRAPSSDRSRTGSPPSPPKAKAKAGTPDSKRAQLAPPKAKASSREASPHGRSAPKAAPDAKAAKVASPAKPKVPSSARQHDPRAPDAAAKSKAAAQSPRSPPAKSKAGADAPPSDQPEDNRAKAKAPVPRQKEGATLARPKESIPKAAKAAGQRQVRVTSRLSTDSEGPHEATAAPAAPADAPDMEEGESMELEEDVRPETSSRMRPPRKRDSQGMVTLREGELESISSIVPTGPEEQEGMEDPSAQPWQNRWRRQSSPQAEGEETLEASTSDSVRPSGMVTFKTFESEDEQPSICRRDTADSADAAFAPVVSERSHMSQASLGSVDQGSQSRRASKELASEAKLVSITDSREDIPVLPAPVESRRRTVVAREFLPPPTDTQLEDPSLNQKSRDAEVQKVPSEQPARRPSQEEKPPRVDPMPDKPAEEEHLVLPEPTDANAPVEDVKDRSLRDLPPPELPKQPIPAEDRASHRSDSPRNRVRVKSRSSFPEGQQRPIRADGLQELLQEVYDKFRSCSAHLRQSGSRQVSPSGEHVAGSEDTDLADTWQEVEWLRQAVVGMHSHLLLAQKRQHALEKKCKDFQDRISEVRHGVNGGEAEDAAATVSAPTERRKPEILVQQQEQPTLTTSTVVGYDAPARPLQYLQAPSQVSPPMSAPLQASGMRWVVESPRAAMPRSAASTPPVSARTRVIVEQSTLARPHEGQGLRATPPHQLRSPASNAAIYAMPTALPGQATPPRPRLQQAPLAATPPTATAPVYMAPVASMAPMAPMAPRPEMSATPPHPYVRSACSSPATPPRGRSEAKWVRSGQATMVPALAANPADYLSRSLTPTRSAPVSLPVQVDPLASPRAVSASPAKGVRAWLSPSTQSTGLLYGSGSISTFATQLSQVPDWVPALPAPPPIVNVQPRFAMPANPFLSQSLP